MQDAFGNRLTTAHAATAAAVDIYTADWIGYGTRLRTIFAAADADPDCAFVNACAASVHMALEASSGFVAARPFLERMRRNAQGATDREQMTVSAVDAWSMGETRIATAIYRELVERYPTDIAAAKWGQYHAFNLGDAVTMRAIAEVVIRTHQSTPEAWGMLSFGEEQCHRLGRAEEAALRALAMKPTESWALHALAHTYESQDRTRDAIRLLSAKSSDWVDRSIFVRGHNWWHLAQFHLDAGEPARALQIHDQHLWGAWPEFAQEQIGAISSLWRLEMAGADVGTRWVAIAEKVAERGFEHILPFHDVHFGYALARGGKTTLADDFLRSMARQATAARESTWAAVALPAAQAAVAHARGDYTKASLLLLPVLGQLHRLGGSHAQRDVLLQTWIHAASRSGDHTAIEDVLARRVKHRAALGSLRRFIRSQRAPRQSQRFQRAA